MGGLVGDAVPCTGDLVGESVGEAVGAGVGGLVGDCVGDFVGGDVGAFVGISLPQALQLTGQTSDAIICSKHQDE